MVLLMSEFAEKTPKETRKQEKEENLTEIVVFWFFFPSLSKLLFAALEVGSIQQSAIKCNFRNNCILLRTGL